MVCSWGWTFHPHRGLGNPSLETKVLLNSEYGITAGDSHAVDTTLWCGLSTPASLCSPSWCGAIATGRQAAQGSGCWFHSLATWTHMRSALVKCTGAKCPLTMMVRLGVGCKSPLTQAPLEPLRLFPASSAFQGSGDSASSPHSSLLLAASLDSLE